MRQQQNLQTTSYFEENSAKPPESNRIEAKSPLWGGIEQYWQKNIEFD